MAEINNAIYEELGERWYQAHDDPVALLRSQAKTLAPWILQTARVQLGAAKLSVVDLGCGAGFISNALAAHGVQVTAFDLSENSLGVAKKYDATKSVDYRLGDVTAVPLGDGVADVVVCCDVIEHVDDPQKIVTEAYRLLKPGGLFFYHTFNRNFLAYLVVIKFVEWFVSNTPDHMHVLKLFVKPNELEKWCLKAGFTDCRFVGLRPKWATLLDRCVFSRTVPEKLEFTFTKNLWLTYAGYTRKGS